MKIIIYIAGLNHESVVIRLEDWLELRSFYVCSSHFWLKIISIFVPGFGVKSSCKDGSIPDHSLWKARVKEIKVLRKHGKADKVCNRSVLAYGTNLTLLMSSSGWRSTGFTQRRISSNFWRNVASPKATYWTLCTSFYFYHHHLMSSLLE